MPLEELDGKIAVDRSTGQIYLLGTPVRLKVPAMVVRHGQTDGNVRHVLQGQVDGPENQLNPNGKAAAERAAEETVNELHARIGDGKLQQLASAGRVVILTSPILRARHTADYFSRHFQHRTGMALSMKEEDALKEISFGKYDGFALEEIDDPVHADLVRRYRTVQDATIDWLGTGESFIDAVVRAQALIERINAAYDGHLLTLFTHGTFISALRTALGDTSLVSETGMLLYRDRILENAVPHWLHGSLQLLDNFKHEHKPTDMA